MLDRFVRFTESFFEDVDDPLPEERSASGAPSATDFALYDLPRLRDALASASEESTLPVRDLAPIRFLAGAGHARRSGALRISRRQRPRRRRLMECCLGPRRLEG